ncbi:MAG: OmpA family protein [Thiotrichales bacterium]
MKQAERLLKSLGILGLSLMVFAALVLGILSYCTPQIDSDIRTASLKALHGVGMGWADIDVSGRVIILDGTAPTKESASRALEMLKSRWSEARILSKVEVLPPLSPYRIDASYDGETLAVHGFAASSDTVASIVQSVALTDKRLEIDLEPREGEPADWADQVAELLRFVMLLNNGKLELRGEEIHLVGSVASKNLLHRFEDLQQRYEAAGYSFELDLSTPPPPRSCAEQLKAVMQGNHVEFVGVGAVVSPNSFELLNDVAAVIRGCQDDYIEILGHCDIAGSRAHNLLLSQQRADSVKDYLTSLGIEERRLISQGYGETKRKRKEKPEERSPDYSAIEFKLVNLAIE